MSFINEALKKAQKERDAGYLKDCGILIGRGKELEVSTRRQFGWSLPLIALLLCALLTYSWLDSGGRQKSITPVSTYKTPPSPPEPVKIDKVKALYDKARVFHKNGGLQDARRLYQEVLRVDPGYVDALNNLGVIYLHERDFAAAQNYLEKAIRLNPKYADIYYNLACLNALQGEVSQSFVYLKKAITLNHEVHDWAQKDTDLTNLRNLPEFKDLMESGG